MAASIDHAHPRHHVPEASLQLVNRLQQSRSPYVSICPPSYLCWTDSLQVRGHMNNPVAWQVWDAESMELAKKHNRLIFLSIGYSACHCQFHSARQGHWSSNAI